MSRMNSAVSIIAVALLLGACAGDTVTGMSEIASARSTDNKVAVDRPFTGDCNLVSEGLVFTGPASATQVIVGTCNLTHLGRSSIVIHESIDFRSLAYSSVAVITAANGDEVHTTINGIATRGATGLSLAGSMQVTGGTGRFANASGTSSQSGFVPFNPAAGPATYQLDGRLAY